MKITDLIGSMEELFGKSSHGPAVVSVSNRPDIQLASPQLEDTADQETMVPPLQQKIELLKKAVDVDNYYDEDNADAKSGSRSLNLTLNVPRGQSSTKIELTLNNPDEIDELDKIKKIAGIPAASIFDAGDDEPLDS